ncbi:5'-3' exoribonuclease 2-like [Paramacrobiotus metropolitanus]|uniref:5'-3' exoribonuclease 2-like n=1 Tax=Paramacrobiotus metropolitanus TaxID=2943436 RepID=UPI00244620B1|nr:5'-3' exoribonuclease 2-like [Paramacrobiotus metropolitanus]
MGVPAFFRWLSRKYPSIVVHATEERSRALEDDASGSVPVDTSLPNPNGVEFDNLYLDMNGIIHPCCHPEDRPAPRNEEEMMLLIFEYIDRIFNIVRPRRLLYMAIDGVAPRAKMNQQRSRRFRSSKEAVEKEEEIRRQKQRLREEGVRLPEKPQQDPTEKFDSNCITPGTEFMDNLAKNLRYYVHNRLNNDPGWAGISVILSDANVPGEGEHKIMDFIRKQRANPQHDPNTHHCLCGADADLIMLGLATHEANFTIIREEFKPGQPKPCELCGQMGHEMKMCTGKAKAVDDQEPPAPPPATEFIFLRLSVLREYLEQELKPDHAVSYGFDLERAIDDWVFMCFFVGNDFLPHLPSLEIREGAIDRLIDLYKANADRSGGYLTENGFVNLERVQHVLTELGKMEDGILKNRMHKAKIDRRREKERERAKRRRDGEEDDRDAKRRRSDGPAYALNGAFSPAAVGRGGAPQPLSNARETIHQARVDSFRFAQPQNTNLTSAQALRAMLIGGPASAPQSPAGGRHPGASPSGERFQRPASVAGGLERMGSRDGQDDDEDPNDVVRLGEDGWKQRYYMNKFAVAIDGDWQFQKEIVHAYVEGLCWVLQYYYQGCPSWTWYYPYHYSPFASDFTHIDQLRITFPKHTQPFKPLEQLMGVFPAASGNFLPTAWRRLMSDPESPILDFYPSDFCVDLNGKKFAWQGVALLPFVDEGRLLRTLGTVYDTLTAEEARRNGLGQNLLFVGQRHTIFTDLKEKFYPETENAVENWVTMENRLIFGMGGLVAGDAGAYIPFRPLEPPYASMAQVAVNRALSVAYRDPWYELDYKFLAVRLEGAKEPAKVLGEGRAILGFDANRTPVRLDGSAHRMLRGASSNRGSFFQRTVGNDGRRGYNEEREARWEDNPNRFREESRHNNQQRPDYHSRDPPHYNHSQSRDRERWNNGYNDDYRGNHQYNQRSEPPRGSHYDSRPYDRNYDNRRNDYQAPSSYGYQQRDTRYDYQQRDHRSGSQYQEGRGGGAPGYPSYTPPANYAASYSGAGYGHQQPRPTTYYAARGAPSARGTAAPPPAGPTRYYTSDQRRSN